VKKKGNRSVRLQKIETVDIARGTLILKPDGALEKNRSNASYLSRKPETSRELDISCMKKDEISLILDVSNIGISLRRF